MKSIFKYSLVVLMFVLLLPACKDDNGSMIEESTGKVKVKLNFSVEDMGYGNIDEAKAATKTDPDDDGILSDVKNLAIIQFDGSESTSLIDQVIYIDKMDDIEVVLNETYLSTLVVFVANTFGDYSFTEGMTLENFKNSCVTLTGEMAVTDKEDIIYDKGLVNEDEDGNKYFLMSGAYVYPNGIQYGTEIRVVFKRNVSKITLKVNNNWEDSEMTQINLQSIPKQYLYYANRTVENETLIPSTVSNVESYLNTVSVLGSEKATKEMTFYVPVNMRGEVEGSTEKTKPLFAPSNATYADIRITKTFDEETVTSYIYKFYLGENLVDDYNLEPNKHYFYEFTFNGMDNVDAEDARVSELTTVIVGTDYTNLESSNCYILNPNENSSVAYYIPIAPRINEYWGNYAKDNTKMISNNDLDNWEYEVLWYDNDNDPIGDDVDLIEQNQICINKYLAGESCIPSLAVTLGQGFDNLGNVLVAVKDSNGSILWSWHLWITDYCPYNHSIEDKAVGSYEVTGGYLNRYSGSCWNTNGLYAEKYIMDRNIGARSAKPTTTDGLLFYQYGRKDPFPYPGSAQNSAGSFSYSTSNGSTKISMQTAVEKPTLIHTTGSNWCSDYIEPTYEWNDESCALYGNKKSIFDPSPYGFILPIYDAISDFSASTFVVTGTSGSAGRGFVYNGNSNIFYPSCGYLTGNNSTTALSGKWSTFAYACSQPYLGSNTSNTYSHSYVIIAYSDIQSQNYIMRSSSTSLRCIEQ